MAAAEHDDCPARLILAFGGDDTRLPLRDRLFYEQVELFTGRGDGTVIGCSAAAARDLAGFVTEPDQRNLEYTTPPEASYRRQLELLLEALAECWPLLAGEAAEHA